MVRALLAMVVIAATIPAGAAASWQNHDAQELPRIAVLDFTNGTVVNAKEADALRSVLGMTLAGALRKSGHFDVVERQQLAAILREQELATSGRIDEATAAKVGKLLGAKYMLLGTYMIQPDREMQVTTRLVDVSTGVIAFAPEVIGDSRAVTGVMGRLALEVARALRVTNTNAPAEKVDNSRIKPEMVRLIDALAKACDRQDSAAVSSVRRDIEAASPGHPALSAPCLK